MGPRGPSTIESTAAWWLPSPGWLGGVASIGGIFGFIPFDQRRFHPATDAMLLRRDGVTLMSEFKRAHDVARRALIQEENAAQQRLFDPDEE